LVPSYRLLADLVVLIHAAFVLFVALGGFLVLRRPAVAWLHLPAAVWGAWIELSSGICPLTPLEKWLRLRAGQSAYAGDFITHYVLPALYPAGLTRAVQLGLGAAVVVLNAVLYWRAFRPRR
jgi:hypothetical protein